MKMIEQIVNNSISTNTFSRVYPFINKYLIENGQGMSSRNGNTKEILNFKTEICDPYARCVGNSNRDINVFFLLAEAMWIFTGRKDVDFLNIFNSNMSQFSDDGKVFHAPYGFRLRHYGVSSSENTKPTSPENNGHYVQQVTQGVDQISVALNMLRVNPDDRRVVMSIWNADFDLQKNSKDIPCNDLVMLKIRNGKLHTTIANRSNDLHWGLPTNVFQFSFMTEIMSLILGIELGTQTHNSQSLHIYTENPIAFKMYENTQFNIGEGIVDLYDHYGYARMDMNFENENVDGRLAEVDHFLNMIIDSVQNRERLGSTELRSLQSFSRYLHLVYDILWIYASYRDVPEKNDDLRLSKISELGELARYYPNVDIIGLSVNFFVSRLKNQSYKSEFKKPIGDL